EAAHKSRKLRQCERWSKKNARDSRYSKELRKTSFACGRSKRDSIQQDLCSRRSQQHTAAAAVFQRIAQLLPGRFKLLPPFRVPKLVQTREFQQNVQAADKRPRPASLFLNHSRRRWNPAPPCTSLTVDLPCS